MHVEKRCWSFSFTNAEKQQRKILLDEMKIQIHPKLIPAVSSLAIRSGLKRKIKVTINTYTLVLFRCEK